MAYLLWRDTEMQADGDGGKHVVDVVCTDEMGRNLSWRDVFGPETEGEERRAACNLSLKCGLGMLSVGDGS